MKKIFLMAYARKNLGDDLFIKMILDRYPMHLFTMKIENKEYLEHMQHIPNLSILPGKDTDEELAKTDIDAYDAYVYVGGSIFMEGGSVYNLSPSFYNFIKKCKEHNKPFFYISCNFGPYQTKEYLDLAKKSFATIQDICFRDQHSYQLFHDIPSIRYAPDFAFTYPLPVIDKIPGSVGISLINLDIRPDLKLQKDAYVQFLINNIKEYIHNGKKVYLYTFCAQEGDEKTLAILKNYFQDEQNVKEVCYQGDIESFLKIYAQMEYMVCARFHAMILSCIARQKMYVMSYSKKLDYVINDLNLELPVLPFHNIQKEKMMKLAEFQKLDEMQIQKIIQQAAEQEKMLHQFLTKK